MRALLDVNVLIALLDQDHSMHDRARSWFAASARRGWRQLTDLYLLALAVRHRGRFVSFDSSIPLTAIKGAGEKHLVTV